MGYLICKNCKGYYELKPGESPDDFEKCECGGSLKFVESLDNTISDNSEPPKNDKSYAQIFLEELNQSKNSSTNNKKNLVKTTVNLNLNRMQLRIQMSKSHQ